MTAGASEPGVRRSYASVLEELVDLIQAGALPIGASLPSERQLASGMKTSRTTVRKALKILAERGVIEAAATGGPRVRLDVVPRDLLSGTQRLTWDDISEVLVARRLFEPQVAQSAGFVATPEDLDELMRIVDLQHAHVTDPERLRELDASYHLAIARATHNRTIVAMIHTLLQRLRPVARPAFTPTQAEEMLRCHTETYEAIASRDTAAIANAMEHHLRFHEQTWEDAAGRRLRQILPTNAIT